MIALPPHLRHTLLEGYLDRVVDRDFPDAGREVRNPSALRRWLVAFAKASATTASFETIRDAATTGHSNPPARSTTIPFRDTLERIWLSDPVPAWSPLDPYGLGRLTSSPKHFLADPALAATLLDVDADALLSGRDAGPPMPRNGTLLGGLFESLAALSLHVFAQAATAGLAHLRTRAGQREVDFVVHGRGRRTVAVEVKLTATPDHHDVRHLLWLKERMGADLSDMVVLTTGRSAYRRQDGVAVVPLSLLGP
jgi:predicted AAA+ superfamily ATPase